MLNNFTAELMPKDNGLGGPAEAIVASLGSHVSPCIKSMPGKMKIRATDPATKHLNPYLSRPGNRLRLIDNFEFSILTDNGPHLVVLHPPRPITPTQKSPRIPLINCISNFDFLPFAINPYCSDQYSCKQPISCLHQ